MRRWIVEDVRPIRGAAAVTLSETGGLVIPEKFTPPKRNDVVETERLGAPDGRARWGEYDLTFVNGDWIPTDHADLGSPTTPAETGWYLACVYVSKKRERGRYEYVCFMAETDSPTGEAFVQLAGKEGMHPVDIIASWGPRVPAPGFGTTHDAMRELTEGLGPDPHAVAMRAKFMVFKAQQRTVHCDDDDLRIELLRLLMDARNALEAYDRKWRSAKER